jgi:hypothetical protein
VHEYRIRRENGRPVLDAKGEPIVEWGPKDHISEKQWRRYRFYRWIVRQVRKLPAMQDHQKPKLTCGLA